MPIDPVGGSSYICLGPWSECPPLPVSDRRPTAVRHNRSLFSDNCSLFSPTVLYFPVTVLYFPKTVLYFPHNSCKPLMTVRYTIYRICSNSFSFDVVRLQTTKLLVTHRSRYAMSHISGQVQCGSLRECKVWFSRYGPYLSHTVCNSLQYKYMFYYLYK